MPYILLSPKNGHRFITYYSAAENRWIQEKSPENAVEIFFDADNNLYTIASGIKIYKRTNDSADWQLLYDEGVKRNCYPKVKLDAESRNAFIHTQGCDEKSFSIYGLRLR